LNSGRFVDACGVVCGTGSTCGGCIGDLCTLCATFVDLCGVCGGNSSTCDGCDGVPASGTVYDICNVCGGNGTSCLGCENVPFADPCPVITPAAIGVVSSLVALASLGALALAAIAWRMRKRPEILYQEWDDVITSHLAEIQNNPLFNDDMGVEFNPLFNEGCR